jgi:hypothetical protein
LLRNPCHTNGDDLNNVKHETGRTFRSKKREYLKEKINELETYSKNKNIRHSSSFLGSTAQLRP